MMAVKSIYFTDKIYSIVYFIIELVCVTREHNRVSVFRHVCCSK